MTRIDIDPRTAERLVAGRVADADLPAGAEGVARVLSAARQAAVESDLSALDATVAAMVATAKAAATTQGAKAATVPPPAPARRIGAPSWVPRLLTVSVAGLTAVFGALAVAGALPSSAQGPVADVVSYVGIQLPRPASTPKGPEQPAATTTTVPGAPTTTVAPAGETTGTTAVTPETTVAAPPCEAPAVITASGCLEPQPSPTTVPPTTTTVPAPPPTTVPPTTTTVPNERTPQGEHSASSDHGGTGDPGLS